MAHASVISRLRLGALLLLLSAVSIYSWRSHSGPTDWQAPLLAVVYPINGDGRVDTGFYIDALSDEHFEDIERFLQREARRYRLPLARPLQVKLAPPLAAQPPLPPQVPSLPGNLFWSIRMQFWSWWHGGGAAPADIRIYMRFFSPTREQPLAHSLGLQKGRIGLVNAFASVDYQPRNNFIAAHELLHTLGAADKYDLATGFPVWPEGYADPAQQPLLPQRRAEIMGGRIQVSTGWALLPKNLEQAVIGTATAREIRWLSTP